MEKENVILEKTKDETNLKNNERLDDLNIKGYQIIQDPGRFCFGMDAVLLSGFAHIKKGDKVKIISGADKGKEGVVQVVYPKLNRVVVEGVNVRKKHRKPTQANPDGAIEEKEAPIHISNVALLMDPKSKKKAKAVRVGYDFDENGKKYRVNHKTGTKLD